MTHEPRPTLPPFTSEKINSHLLNKKGAITLLTTLQP